jgi:hypothetical protein
MIYLDFYHQSHLHQQFRYLPITSYYSPICRFYLNGNEQTRKLLIYQAIFTTFDTIAKKKKIKNLEVVKEYINKKIEELNK